MKDETRLQTASLTEVRGSRFAFILLASLLLGGCDGRPRAPALQSGPLYQNEREGVRFLAAEGGGAGGGAEPAAGPLGKAGAARPFHAWEGPPRRTGGDAHRPAGGRGPPEVPHRHAVGGGAVAGEGAAGGGDGQR